LPSALAAGSFPSSGTSSSTSPVAIRAISTHCRSRRPCASVL
jgi:hypothetical protein